MNNGAFDINLFIKESKDILQNPKLYFSTMKTSGGFTEPVIKAVIYGALAGAISFIWSLFNLSASGSLLGSSVGVMIFVSSIMIAVVGLFIGGVVSLVISSICKGSTDYEANVRVTAASMVIMPISALLGFTNGINFYLGAIVGLCINIFAIWILYNGLVEALKTKAETTRIVSYILIGLLVIALAVSLGKLSKMDKFMNDKFMNDNKDLKELMKDLEKN
jgi:hypothetical protein